jgi:hypothetical protein
MLLAHPQQMHTMQPTMPQVPHCLHSRGRLTLPAPAAPPFPPLACCSIEFWENGAKIGSQMTNQNALTEKINWEGNASPGKKLTIK